MPTENPFDTLEAQAYHAFREWHIWLALRERELAAHLAPSRPPHPAPPDPAPAQSPGDPSLVTRGE